MSDASTTVASPFVEACFGRPHERVPIWMMRQAGRYLPEYRNVREQYTFLEMCHTPKVAAEVTLQPLRRFDLDAAIIFSDILIFLPDMGLRVDFPGGGPQIENPLSSPADVDALLEFDPAAGGHAVYEAIRICTAELAGTKPLIGFAGCCPVSACPSSPNWRPASSWRSSLATRRPVNRASPGSSLGSWDSVRSLTILRSPRCCRSSSRFWPIRLWDNPLLGT